MSKIIGITVGTPMNPQAIVDKTQQAEQIEKNKESIARLSEEIDDKQPRGNYASATHTHDEYLTESDLDALEEKIDSDVYKQSVADKVPYVKVAEHPICVNSVSEMTDTSKMYVLNSDGMFYSYKTREITTEGTSTPNFTNVIDGTNGYIKEGYRYSLSSKAFKEYTALAKFAAIVIPVPTSGNLTVRVRGMEFEDDYPSIYGGTSNSEFTSAMGNQQSTNTKDDNGDWIFTANNTYNVSYIVTCGVLTASADDVICTVNEEITYTTTEGGTETITEWSNTGISYNQPADYEIRVIANEQDINSLKGRTSSLENQLKSISISSNGTTVFDTPAFAPVPQLPADGSEGSDFNSNTITTQDAYAYMDALANKYTNYIYKQTMGKDASNSFDHNRYILSKAYWRAWQKENYPKMFAWINGSTVIYSVSVSPRVGDNMYSTPYVGTVYKTVTSVNCTAGTLSTRTVNGLIFTRHTDGDIEPTVVYTKVHWGPNTFNTATVYNASFASLTKVSSVGSDSFVGQNGITYIRYPFEDRKADKTKPLSVFVLSNEHGLNGDALIPSMVVMRMAKDLCKNTNNPFLNWLRENCMITMIPVGNPWGYGRYLVNNSSGYYNSNGININRNYDTPGWATSDTNYGDVETFGSYAGCEVETQHIMNTIRLCNADVGISMHGLGLPTEYKDLPDNGYFVYQGQGFEASRVDKIAETLFSAYGLGINWSTDYAQHYEMCGKSPAYIHYAGAVGGLTETICWEVGTSNTYTPLAMEQAYTQLLVFLQTWCEEAIEKMS